MPQVSIITVCLNNRKGLELTIQSVLEQEFKDFEFIIVDGGSTDGSVDLIKQNGKDIAKWVSEKDDGIFNAQNKGIDLANGTWLLFLNAGDYLHDTEVLKDVFSKERTADIVYGNMLICYPGNVRRKGVMPSRLTFRHMMQDTLWHPVSFIRRELFKTSGKFDEQFRIASDYEFFVRAVLVEKRFTQKVNRVISCFDAQGVSSAASSREKLNAERRTIQLKYFSEEEVDAGLKVNAFQKLFRRVKRRLSL